MNIIIILLMLCVICFDSPGDFKLLAYFGDNHESGSLF